MLIVSGVVKHAYILRRLLFYRLYVLLLHMDVFRPSARWHGCQHAAAVQEVKWHRVISGSVVKH